MRPVSRYLSVLLGHWPQFNNTFGKGIVMIYISQKHARQEGLFYTEIHEELPGDCESVGDSTTDSAEDRAVTEFFALLKRHAVENPRPQSSQAC